jgi:hypothetical protein
LCFLVQPAEQLTGLVINGTPNIIAGCDPPIAIAGSAAHRRARAAASPQRHRSLDWKRIESRAINVVHATVERDRELA